MKKSHPMDVLLGKRVQMTISIVVITLGGIALFGGAGYLLDQYFGTKPILLFALIIISFPVTQLALYKRVRQLTKDL